VRSSKYLKLIRGEPCVVCGSPFSVQAHHMRHAAPLGWGRKVSDEFCVALCALCHADCHTRGRESEWWAMNGIDGLGWAENFYKKFLEEEEA